MKIQDRLFKISASENRPGKIATPDVISEPCALLVFNHGVGESGDGTLANVGKLFANGEAIGPLGFVNSTSDFAFIHPKTKKSYKFIVVSLQGTRGWCLYPDQIAYAIENDIFKDYNIDKNAVFITGLSAGGAATADSIVISATAKLYAAAVPMSQASAGSSDISPIINNDIKVWMFCGDADWAYRTNAQYMNDQIAKVKPANTRLTFYPGGHGLWNRYYDPSYREIFTVGVSKYTMNIYEWMLYNMKTPIVVAPPPIVTPGGGGGTTTDPVDVKPIEVVITPDPIEVVTPPVVVEPPVDVVAPPIVSFDKDNIEMLSAVGSINIFGTVNVKITPAIGRTISKVTWEKVSGPANGYVQPNGNFIAYFKGMAAGVHTFKITVTDDKGQSTSKELKITATATLPVVPKVVDYYIVTTVYTDGVKETQNFAKDKITIIK